MMSIFTCFVLGAVAGPKISNDEHHSAGLVMRPVSTQASGMACE